MFFNIHFVICALLLLQRFLISRLFLTNDNLTVDNFLYDSYLFYSFWGSCLVSLGICLWLILLWPTSSFNMTYLAKSQYNRHLCTKFWHIFRLHGQLPCNRSKLFFSGLHPILSRYFDFGALLMKRASFLSCFASLSSLNSRFLVQASKRTKNLLDSSGTSTGQSKYEVFSIFLHDFATKNCICWHKNAVY